MNGTAVAFGFVGVALGFALAHVLVRPSESSAVARINAAVRAKVADQLGAGAANVGDKLGLWKYGAGALDLFGVDP